MGAGAGAGVGVASGSGAGVGVGVGEDVERVGSGSSRPIPSSSYQCPVGSLYLIGSLRTYEYRFNAVTIQP